MGKANFSEEFKRDAVAMSVHLGGHPIRPIHFPNRASTLARSLAKRVRQLRLMRWALLKGTSP